jgi:putative ABC transport system permease protein
MFLLLTMSDLKFAFRQLLKNPGFTAVAVLTLALGIGANTAIFTLANAILLRPLPGVERPDQLVLVGRTHNGAGFDALSYPDYADYRDQNTVLSGFVAYRRTGLYAGSGDSAQSVAGALVSNNYFSVLGARAVKGRTLLPEDEAGAGAHPVCVISYGLWRRYFDLAPNIVGRSMNLNDHRYTIVGVMTEEFIGTEAGNPLDLWLPITMYAQADPIFTEKRLEARHIVWLKTFGRLKANVTVEQAQAQLSALARHLEETYPDTNKGKGVSLFPSLRLEPESHEQVSRSTALLMSVVALVLLIACANVANLLLARGTARQREIGIRLALGASRGRLIRQLLTEALLLGLAGGAVGLFVAFLANDFLVNVNPLTRIRFIAIEVGLDQRVFGFALMVSFLSTLIFGLAPAWQVSKPELVSRLKDRSGGAARRSRFPSGLVVGQIALSLVTLISAGLLVRTLQKIQQIRPGFDTTQVLLAPLDLGRQGYSEAQGKLLYQQIIQTVETLPGVSAASLAVTLPLGGSWRTGLHVEGDASSEPETPCDYNIIAPHYFETTGIPLVSGRDFSQRDNASAPGVVIINETFARQLFPNQNPLGKRLFIPNTERAVVPFEIIGVAKDAKYRWLTEAPQPFIYLSALQQYQSFMTLYLRAHNDPSTLIKAVRDTLQTLDSRLLISNLTTLAERLHGSLRPQRGAAMLVGTFGLLALLLSSVGLYGLMAYVVSQRTQEIGLRMALGAQTHDISKMVLGEGMALVALGIVAGLAGAITGSRWLSSFLYGVSATDPMTFVGIVLLLGGVALLACWLPARRAATVDPMEALRHE